jgi:hypothetical protein
MNNELIIRVRICVYDFHYEGTKKCKNILFWDVCTITNDYFISIFRDHVTWVSSSRNGAFSSCGWRRWLPDMEGSCKYIE